MRAERSDLSACSLEEKKPSDENSERRQRCLPRMKSRGRAHLSGTRTGAGAVLAHCTASRPAELQPAASACAEKRARWCEEKAGRVAKPDEAGARGGERGRAGTDASKPDAASSLVGKGFECRQQRREQAANLRCRSRKSPMRTTADDKDGSLRPSPTLRGHERRDLQEYGGGSDTTRGGRRNAR